ncbi:NFAT activation molecule 1 [Ctenodactylus gundi]
MDGGSALGGRVPLPCIPPPCPSLGLLPQPSQGSRVKAHLGPSAYPSTTRPSSPPAPASSAAPWQSGGLAGLEPLRALRMVVPDASNGENGSRQLGGQSVTHTGLPIMASLANMDVSFGCRVQYTPEVKHFTVSYFYVDLRGRNSSEKQTTCQGSPGLGNQTAILDCEITPRLPDASATGTYYCCVRSPGGSVSGDGTFILVRDVGYRTPPLSSQKALLFGFTGFLAFLSVLGTSLLLWKKKQMLLSGRKLFPKTGLNPRSASQPPQPPAESVYTALQSRETEVYACIETETQGSSLPSQEKPQRVEDDHEFNLLYENL